MGCAQTPEGCRHLEYPTCACQSTEIISFQQASLNLKCSASQFALHPHKHQFVVGKMGKMNNVVESSKIPVP
jgi:hypothetical protein